MRLLLVEWDDSRTADSGWRYLGEPGGAEAVKCRTVGWLIEEGDSALLLAQSLGDEATDAAQSMGRTAIARRQITAVYELAIGPSFSIRPYSGPASAPILQAV